MPVDPIRMQLTAAGAVSLGLRRWTQSTARWVLWGNLHYPRKEAASASPAAGPACFTPIGRLALGRRRAEPGAGAGRGSTRPGRG